MTRAPAAAKARRGGPWPPLDYPGLHVDLGEHTKPWSPEYGVWLRQPYAELRCAAGCTHHAHGAEQVAFLLANLGRLQHDPPTEQEP
ncbi:hypothetical protein AB0J25_12015 [Streptomyces sp. NPDC049910]|uniref:hypothetical protein n=1 Tax=Streptomyces sp. NPDC049910 TaxID=3155278 RepID=UPI00341585B4